MNTPWDALHRAYFNGYALWTYLTTPFLIAMDGVRIEETESWHEGVETWRVLRATFPGSFETHNLAHCASRVKRRRDRHARSYLHDCRLDEHRMFLRLRPKVH
jgi:hypothetical protein